MMDYDEEGLKLWSRLDDTKQGKFNNFDPVFWSEAGGFIYIVGDLVRRTVCIIISFSFYFRLENILN